MRLIPLALSSAILLGSSLAFADALPPQVQCPSGKVLVMNHGGGRCVDAKPRCKPPMIALQDGSGYSCAAPAPTSCPNGWRGETSLRSGPQCVVTDCTGAPC